MKAPRICNFTFWHQEYYRLDAKSAELFNEIMDLFERIEPMRETNNCREVWLSAERGTLADMNFADEDDACDFFEIDDKSKLQEAFEERYPDKKYWFLIQSAYNEDGKVIRIKETSIYQLNYKHGKEEYEKLDLSGILTWIRDALIITFNNADKYCETAEKEIPFEYRYGTISRKDLYDNKPARREFRLKDLSDKEIEEFIKTVEAEDLDYIPQNKIKDMTFNKYFEYAVKAFEAAGYSIVEGTLYEQFKGYGEDFGGQLLEKMDYDSPEDFQWFCDEKNHLGGHPWGLLRGSSRTRVMLLPTETEEGFYFRLFGNEIYMAYEIIKMYMALKKSGFPVKLSYERNRLFKYLRQEDLVGIVPYYQLPLYCYSNFPDDDIEEFMHYHSEEDGKIFDSINWIPIKPIVFRGEKQ